ncbi:hypothetical protein [Alicyclobacillus sp. SO9]|uniref:hypothetical protein n=1 Tax=Alicyclobacillus sp. SO9 TaxID=2665646 RepID=UPI0018E90473|nr:hypothetical protein [Alicyclobacillus sp. SO9]QQE81014.1 hypothetical protein GI364_11910 [Alicyclobacillus sp. SO9]
MSSVPEIGMHQILSSVVHLPFKSAIKQVGCCEFSEKDFTTGIDAYLAKLSDPALLEGIDTLKLWSAMMSGEVLAVEYAENQSFIFQVRGKVSGRFIDMKFSYRRDDWDVIAVTSIHQRPVWRSRSRAITEAVLGVAAIATISILATHSHAAAYSKQGVKAWAQNNGYKLVSATTPASATKQTASPAAKPTNSTSSSAGTSSSGSSAGSKTATSNTTATSTSAPKPQKFSFTLKKGMSVHAISVFLQQHKLVSNAYAFDQVLHKTGVEKQIWPGTYTFTSGMKQQQILSVLKSKP